METGQPRSDRGEDVPAGDGAADATSDDTRAPARAGPAPLSPEDRDARARAFFDLSPDPAFVHDGAHVLMANQALAGFLGHTSAQDLVGVSIFSFIEPESRARLRERIEAMFTHLEQALVTVGYFDPAQPKRLMSRLRRLLARAQPSDAEVDILRGIAAAIIEKRAERAGRKGGR